MIGMKNWLIGGVAALAMAMVGCSAPAAGGGETTTPAKEGEAKKFKIAVSIPTATHGWTAGVVDWAEKAKEQFASDADITIYASESVDDQADKLGTLATQGYDGLVILSFDPAAVTPAVKMNRDSFGYIVSVDRGLAEPIADVWLRGDNMKFGSEAAKFMAEKLGGKGNILVLRGMAGPVDEDRVKGFEEVMKGFPDIKILAMQPGDWNQDKAFTVTQNLLLKHKDVNAIWAADDDMALGAEKALTEAGLSDVWMVGGGGSKVVVKRVMDGDKRFPATVTYSPKMIELAIARMVEDLKAGKKPSGPQVDEVLPVDLVLPTNAKDHYFEDSVY